LTSDSADSERRTGGDFLLFARELDRFLNSGKELKDGFKLRTGPMKARPLPLLLSILSEPTGSRDSNPHFPTVLK